MEATDLFYWHREAPADWVAALAHFAPPLEALAWLECWWEPGTPADPTQRWVLYEVTPLASYFAPMKVSLVLEAGPACRCPREPTAYGVGRCTRCAGKRSPGFRRIYDRFQATGCLAEPYWIMQGTNGGHRVDFTPIEAQWDLLLGGPGYPPAFGSLPPAPLDARTFRRLRSLDRTHQAWRTLQTTLGAQQQQAEQHFRATLWDHAGRSAEQVIDDHAVAALLSVDLPRHTQEPDWDARHDRYVTTGVI